MKTNESLLFLKSFFRSPKNVGSIIPSSRFLASKMVSQAPWLEAKAVAELGSGTGAITRYINNQVQQSTKVLLFEMDETMRHQLQSTFPRRKRILIKSRESPPERTII